MRIRQLINRLLGRQRPITHSYLYPADRPVIAGLEMFEHVYAKDQPEYIPLRTLVSRTGDGKVMSRWTLTADQRRDIANGADIFLTLMTFGQSLQPITLSIGDGLNPEYFQHEFNLVRGD